MFHAFQGEYLQGFPWQIRKSLCLLRFRVLAEGELGWGKLFSGPKLNFPSLNDWLLRHFGTESCYLCRKLVLRGGCSFGKLRFAPQCGTGRVCAAFRTPSNDGCVVAVDERGGCAASARCRTMVVPLPPLKGAGMRGVSRAGTNGICGCVICEVIVR